MSRRIDDPVDASLAAWLDEPEGPGQRLNSLALIFAGLVFPPAAVLQILKDQFQNTNRFKRVEYLFGAMRRGIKLLESQLGTESEKVKELQARIETTQFQAAVATASEEAARATSNRTIERLAAVLVGALKPGEWDDHQGDLATLVRDLAQLGDQDICVLGILRILFENPMRLSSNFINTNAVSEIIGEYRSAIGVNHIDPDTFYSVCARLAGFGLSIEVDRSVVRNIMLNEYCYRPTRRGLALLDCLKRFGGGETNPTS